MKNRGMIVWRAVWLLLAVLCVFLTACDATEPSETTVEATTTAATTEATTTAPATTTAATTTEATTTEVTTTEANTTTTEPTTEVTAREATTAYYCYSPCEGYPDENLPELGFVSDQPIELYTWAPCGDMSNGERFAVSLYAAGSGHRIYDIHYYNSTAGYWDKYTRYLGGHLLGMFALDDRNCVFICDAIWGGYNLGITTDCFHTIEMLGGCGMWATLDGKPYPHGGMDYLFSEEGFVPFAESEYDENNFYKHVTDYYLEPIDSTSCRIVLKYEKDGEIFTRTAIYDRSGVHPE